MAWGSSQEATAVLVAVNYFQKHGIKVVVDGAESHTVVAEAGKKPFQLNKKMVHIYIYIYVLNNFCYYYNCP